MRNAASTLAILVLVTSAAADVRYIDHPRQTPGGRFGEAVASLGSELVVGAPGTRSDAAPVAGAFRVDAAGTLLTEYAPPAPGRSGFGSAVAATVATVAIGEPERVVANAVDLSFAGAVHLFDPATGVLLRTLANPTGQYGQSFGSAVAFLGDDVLVGAPMGGGGVAYLFDASTGALLATFTEPAGGRFGTGVAAVAGVVVVAAPLSGAAGALHVFDPGGALLRTITVPGSGNFGVRIAAAGTLVAALDAMGPRASSPV